jgi:holo-[acyl-carrier protein] synthase
MYTIGIDILMIPRIRSWVHDDDMMNYVFTRKERTSARKKRHPHTYLAKIFATKEAFLKAIGTGWSNAIGWKDIEVIEGKGSISLKFYRKVKELCNNKLVFASASCADSLAVAIVAISDTEQESQNALCRL